MSLGIVAGWELKGAAVKGMREVGPLQILQNIINQNFRIQL